MGIVSMWTLNDGGTRVARVEAITIPTPAGYLSGVVHLPDRIPGPVVVCCHGLLSSKDSSKFALAGTVFSDGGFAVLRFDFSGCGDSEALPTEDLLRSRTRDLDCALDYVREQSWARRGQTVLFGSSLGGYVALLAAASGSHDIGAVVCWATPFDLSKVEQALETSKLLGARFPEGFVLGIPRDLGSMPPVPHVLIIHGGGDETVPWKDAILLYEQVGEPRALMLMRTADHRFLDPDWRGLAIRLSLEWFQDRFAPHVQ
jgi:uncharacterized protein